MRRCIELASNGLGTVAPNPMAGCVIVQDGKIIGEGFHRKFGEAHAEVNAINDAIKKHGEEILSRSTLYVSLEPCTHTGKTPPCADLIIKTKIPIVYIGCIDPFPQVNGKGVERLRKAGIEVHDSVLEKECRELNKRFFTFHEKNRPYIILKYAQSKDGFIAPLKSIENKQSISNDYSRKLVHKWRSEAQAIMIGTNTAVADNPFLTVRDWRGKNPLRVVIDRSLKLPTKLNIFNSDAPTLVFNEKKNERQNGIEWVAVDFGKNFLNDVLQQLYKREIQSVIVEGGAKLLQSFINENLWDEARIFIGDKWLGDGIKAPVLNGTVINEEEIVNDRLIVLNREPLNFYLYIQ
jgi:diaminohydroxyphosphoribosylaminopyrimidine deaminase/5-amino-6-(5-phosphoribosylamino)uracil reductase